MATETRFSVSCMGETHTIIISTEMIPDPDQPGIVLPSHIVAPDRELVTAGVSTPTTGLVTATDMPGERKRSPRDHYRADKPADPKLKMIPAPHLEFIDHCACTDHAHCDRTCDGQHWMEGRWAYLKMAEIAEESCAQFFLEFIGSAAKRIERAWWELRK